MDKAKIAKIVTKAVLSTVVSAAIGYAIKGQKVLDAKIDDHFTTETPTIES